MKKTLIFALVLGLAVMFAVPAFAFKIEGRQGHQFLFWGSDVNRSRGLESQ